MPIIPNDTVSSILDLVNRANPISVVQPPLSRARFALDASGIAGFFGGDTAVRAMATVYLIRQRRWFGWYNAPGAYEVAKQYSGIAKSSIFNALFPGGDGDAGKIFTVVDRQVDLEYTPLYTGRPPSSIGPIGLLFVRKLLQMRLITEHTQAEKMDTVGENPSRAEKTDTVEGNTIGALGVTFVGPTKVDRQESHRDSLRCQESDSATIFSILTILISVGGCVTCALVGDWFCFGSIAIGIVANGMACWVIGSGRLYINNNTPAHVDDLGDVLLTPDTDIIVLLGKEGVVLPLTRGRFTLDFGVMPRDSWWYQWQIPMDHLIHISTVFLLLFQFLAQLLLIPQGTLFGQLMFIGTLVSSWLYHLYLSTLRMGLQTDALLDKLSIRDTEDIYQHAFSTRTEAAVFSCLAFRSIHILRLDPKVMEEMAEESQYLDDAHREKAEKEAEKVDTALQTLLFALIPGETRVLQAFRESLVRKMSRSAIITYARDENPSFNFDNQDASVLAANGEIRVRKWDIPELREHQENAQQALRRWRSEFWNKEEMLKLSALYK